MEEEERRSTASKNSLPQEVVEVDHRHLGAIEVDHRNQIDASGGEDESANEWLPDYVKNKGVGPKKRKGKKK